MLVSVITPAHKPDWLVEVWNSLLAQSYQNFEWVVLANGNRTRAVSLAAQSICKDDSRLHLLQSNKVHGVGALKRKAFHAAEGELLVELDYDDILTPDALQKLVNAAESGPESSFLYSDDVTCKFDWSQPDNGAYVFHGSGWKNYEWSHNGRSFMVNRCFPVTPCSLSSILYAPDHVRAWTRSAYEASGGHNPEMAVADDHDLIVRTYLAGAEFIHIPEPLYFHRFDSHNTSAQRVQEILTASTRTRDMFFDALVKEWCRREELPAYDLGGALNCPEGMIPIDRNLEPGKEGICADVLDGLPMIPDNSVGMFRACDFLEHIPIGSVIPVLNMLYRKLVPGGYLITITPSVCDDEGLCGVGAYQDPDHRSFWHARSWLYYTDRTMSKFAPTFEGRFQVIRNFVGYASKLHRDNHLPYVWADLVALKDGMKHIPGSPKI